MNAADGCQTCFQDVLDLGLKLPNEVDVVDGFRHAGNLVDGAGGVESLPFRWNVFAQFSKKVFAFGNLLTKSFVT